MIATLVKYRDVIYGASLLLALFFVYRGCEENTVKEQQLEKEIQVLKESVRINKGVLEESAVERKVFIDSISNLSNELELITIEDSIREDVFRSRLNSIRRKFINASTDEVTQIMIERYEEVNFVRDSINSIN